METKERNKLQAIYSGVGNLLSFVRGQSTLAKTTSKTFNAMINEAIQAIDCVEEGEPLGRIQQLDILEEQMVLITEAVATMNLDSDIAEYDDTFPEEEWVSELDELGNEVM